MNSFFIGDLLIPVPVIQGGMGVGVSLSGLASAVANNGGVGVISSVGIDLVSPRQGMSRRIANTVALVEEITKTRNLTNGVLGVNIMVVLTNYAQLVKAAINAKIDIVFSGAGLPLDLPSYLTNDSKTKLVPIVSSARAADIICQKWLSRYNYLPDAIVVEGPKAGGHLGFKNQQMDLPEFQLENLVPEVLKIVNRYADLKKIPVIAAGGIFNGKDIYQFMQLGASAVQLGSRFVATEECDAHPDFKNAYLKSRKSDIIIINSPVGMPGRAIRNEYLDLMNNAEKRPMDCPYHCIKSCDYLKSEYCIAAALVNAQKGNLDHGFVFAGQNAYRIRRLTTVQKLMKLLDRQYKNAEKAALAAG